MNNHITICVNIQQSKNSKIGSCVNWPAAKLHNQDTDLLISTVVINTMFGIVHFVLSLMYLH